MRILINRIPLDFWSVGRGARWLRCTIDTISASYTLKTGILLFYCLDFIVSSKVRSFASEGRSYVLLWQAEDTEFDAISPVFSAITASLLNQAKRANAMINDEF